MTDDHSRIYLETSPQAIAPSRAFYFYPNVLFSHAWLPPHHSSSHCPPAGVTVLVAKPTMLVQSSQSSVHRLRLITRSGLRPATPAAPLEAIVEVALGTRHCNPPPSPYRYTPPRHPSPPWQPLVGIALRAMTMTVVTSLKETFIFSIDPSAPEGHVPLRLEMPLSHNDAAT